MTEAPAVDPHKVFVIHGRNEPARAAFFTFLRALGLTPIEWTEAVRATGQGSPYIGDVLEAAFASAQAVATRLDTAGCTVNTTGTDWHTAGDLTPPPPPGGGLPLGRKIPSAHASGLPRLEARLVKHGGNTLDEVVVTNHGPGDVLDLDIAADEGEGLITRQEAGFPVPRLPAGKSVKAMRTKSLGHGHSPYFTITLTATTLDGTPIELEEFVS